MFRFGLSSDRLKFTADKFDGYGEGAALPLLTESQRIAVVCDVETTGLDLVTDEIIEVAARKIVFDKDTGQISLIGPAFQALQQPVKPLPPMIIKLTGLSDKDLEGQRIDWEVFDAFIDDAAIIIAHNSAFDRPRLEKLSIGSRKKIWGCSSFHLDWKDSYPVAKLELLALFHGFFYDSHRALSDVDAVIRLLGYTLPADESSTYLAFLLRNSKLPNCHIIAEGSPFETKDILRINGYRWNAEKRVWSKLVRADRRLQEEEFLATSVYGGKGFLGRTVEIPLKENFRS